MRGVMRDLAEQTRLVLAFKASGLSAQAFARREGLPPSTLCQWLRNGRTPAPAVRVARVIGSGHVVTAGGRPVASAPALVVEVGAARVHVSAGCDPRTLAAVFEALGASHQKQTL
jgi:DNA-binding transcriptional regulator YdaS (Cro superfamily)